MYKYLALAALLGSSDAKQMTQAEKEGLEIAKGFFMGSATVDDPPHHDKSLEECMEYLEHVNTYADMGVKSLKKDTFADVMEGIKMISTMLHMITTSQSRCSAVKANWERIKQMADAWSNPKDFEYTPGHEIELNGINMYKGFQNALKHFEAKKFVEFGWEIGVGSEQLLIGETLMKKGLDPRKPDPEKLYFQKMGAEFAQGYLYGIQVGGFDEKVLFSCMMREPRAEGVFFNGIQEMQRSMYQNKPQLGVKALNDFARFIFDLAMEPKKDDGKNTWKQKNRQCPQLTVDQTKLGDARRIIFELIGPQSKITWDEKKGELTFNGQVLGDELSLIMEAFVINDFEKMGFIFGDTLDKHSVWKRRNPDKLDDHKHLFLY